MPFWKHFGRQNGSKNLPKFNEKKHWFLDQFLNRKPLSFWFRNPLKIHPNSDWFFDWFSDAFLSPKTSPGGRPDPWFYWQGQYFRRVGASRASPEAASKTIPKSIQNASQIAATSASNWHRFFNWFLHWFLAPKMSQNGSQNQCKNQLKKRLIF